MRDHQEACVLFHAGELGAAERLEFERHRESCPSCRELLEALALGSRAARAGALEPPARSRVRAAAASRGSPSGSVAAVAAVVVLLLWGTQRRAAAPPSWSQIDRELSAARAEMDDLSSSIAGSDNDVEIDEDLRGLENEARRLRRDL